MEISNGIGYRDFSDFLNEHFDCKVQKIAVNAGFVCPNRDGSLGTGGCTYCNNASFSPAYCTPVSSVTSQILQGKEFFARKYPQMKYLAYFQAYTNTYGDYDHLISLYEEALAVEDVVGLIVATRPDCMPDDLLDYFSKLAERTFVMIEYGVETSHNRTLEAINRGHTWEQAVDAITRTARANVHTGAHLILGLPGETVSDILDTARNIATMPLDTIKLHQLQVISGTTMAKQWQNGEISILNWSAEEYIDVCIQFMQLLPPTIAIERFVSQAPDGLLLHPKWGLKNYQFTNLLHNKLKNL